MHHSRNSDKGVVGDLGRGVWVVGLGCQVAQERRVVAFNEKRPGIDMSSLRGRNEILVCAQPLPIDDGRRDR